jgi:hypothetical protein
MEIHVFANSQQMGPFPLDSVIDMARMGSLPAEAMVWHEGATDWYPLSRLLAERAPGVVLGAGAAPVEVAEPARPSSPAFNPPQVSPKELPSTTGYVVRGVAAGFGVAVAGGLLWFGISVAAGFRIPFVGLAVGWGVGRVTAWASRNESSLVLPISAVLWTFLACAPLSAFSVWSLLSLAFACHLAWQQAAD